MDDQRVKSRREFLETSARTVVASGLLASGACSLTETSRPTAPQGPEPRPIAPDQVLRLGVVGVGGRGGGLLRSAMKHEKVSIKAIADPNDAHRNKAVQLVRQFLGQTPETYSGEEDYLKVIAREDIDAVILATPCYLHARMYLACLAGGKHFYGEKPMCIDAGDADALVAAQQANPKVVAQIGFQRRASECYREGIRRLHEGVIGPMISGRATWNVTWGPLGGKGSSGTSFWFGRRDLSGDWMLEQACHSWDVLCWAVGALPVAAYGIGRKDIFTDVDPGRDVTDYYLAHVEFPNGMVVDFEHNWFCPHKDEGRFTGTAERIAGPKGGIDLTGGKIFPRDPKGEVIDLHAPKDSGALTVLAIGAFLDSVRTGTPPISGVINGRQATYTGLLVRKSVDEKRRVRMSEIG
jgi:predicted dehydrogenase